MRPHTNTRHHVRRPTGQRAVLHQVYHEGVGAFYCGMAEADCPYRERQQHAAWRIGWIDAETRTRAIGSSLWSQMAGE
jgi:ribosome modulation factor